MIRKTFTIWMDEGLRLFGAIELLNALRAVFPGLKWSAENTSNDSDTIAGRFQVAPGEDATPELLKAALHYLDDGLAGMDDPEGKIAEIRSFTGLWNNGIACRYDRLNPELMEWEQLKLIPKSNAAETEPSP